MADNEAPAAGRAYFHPEFAGFSRYLTVLTLAHLP
jgi:hypothetical protein